MLGERRGVSPPVKAPYRWAYAAPLANLLHPILYTKEPVFHSVLVGDFRDRRTDNMMYRVPLVFTPQPEGGYTVTSPVIPEFLTEGDTLAEAHANVRDAFDAVAELYADQGRILPPSIGLPAETEVVWSEILVDHQ